MGFMGRYCLSMQTARLMRRFGRQAADQRRSAARDRDHDAKEQPTNATHWSARTMAHEMGAGRRSRSHPQPDLPMGQASVPASFAPPPLLRLGNPVATSLCLRTCRFPAMISAAPVFQSFTNAWAAKTSSGTARRGCRSRPSRLETTVMSPRDPSGRNL